MKTLSLKLDVSVYNETEQLLQKIKKPRNRYINEALDFYNKLQKKKMLAELLERESRLVSEESMSVLHEFEQFDDHEG
jgi:predicted transcriptional regulator